MALPPTGKDRLLLLLLLFFGDRFIVKKLDEVASVWCRRSLRVFHVELPMNASNIQIQEIYRDEKGVLTIRHPDASMFRTARVCSCKSRRDRGSTGSSRDSRRADLARATAMLYPVRPRAPSL